jgi:SAM-dependent methyltransferase
MDKMEFDKFAEEYAASLQGSIKVSGESIEYFAEYKVRDVVRTVSNHGLSVRRILDFGCGIGGATPYFRALLPDAELVGVDVSKKSLDIARMRFGDVSMYQEFDGRVLPFNDGAFDVVFAACVFHHIPESIHVELLSEIRRVLSPDGMFFVFEHNPLNPLTVRVVRQCPFDENAVLMRAGQLKSRLETGGMRVISLNYRVFFPNFLRALRRLESSLTWCPLGAQYFLCAKK